MRLGNAAADDSCRHVQSAGGARAIAPAAANAHNGARRRRSGATDSKFVGTGPAFAAAERAAPAERTSRANGGGT